MSRSTNIKKKKKRGNAGVKNSLGVFFHYS